MTTAISPVSLAEAMQLATYLGWLMPGVPGGLIAGGLFVIPSVFCSRP